MERKKLIVMIARGKDDFGAWIDNLPGVYGSGDTVEGAKKNLLDGLKLFVEYNDELPEILQGDYEIEYHFDISSFLEYYSDIFTKSALERITGVNQKQLGHYASGHRKPSKKTIEKIDNALHQLFDELSQVRLAV